MAPVNREKNDRSTEQLRKLFIGGLTLDTTEQDLREYYGKWGEIVDAVVMENKMTGRSRGFGFVTYSDPEMVNVAQANRPHELRGRVVESKRATPREESDNRATQQAVNRLFIGGLKKELTEERLREYFSTYGNVTDLEIPKAKETGEPRGFCFITFDDYDPVDKAVLFKHHAINGVSFDVKKAISKDQMTDMRRNSSHNSSYQQPMSDRRGPRAPPPPSSYYDNYGRYPYPEDPYMDRYGAPPAAPVAPAYGYEDPYGNGWSDAPYADPYAAPPMGAYEEQPYRGGPIRDRGYESAPRSAPYSARPARGTRR